MLIGKIASNPFSSKKIKCRLDKNLVRPNDIDLQIGRTGSQAIVANATGAFTIDTPSTFFVRNQNGSETMFKSTVDGSVELYFDSTKRLHTTPSGADVTGTLNVTGVSTFADEVRIPDYIHHVGDNDCKFGFESGDTFAIETAGSERLRVTSDGKIGIGTDAPAAKTHISQGYTAPTGGLDSNIVLAVTKNTAASDYAGIAINSGNAGGAFIHFGDTDDSNIGVINYDSDNTMRFSTNASERMRIDSSGRLRIASTAESADGAFDDLIIGNNSGNRGISILSGATAQGALGFAKSGSTADGYLAYVHQSTATDSYMTLKSSGTIRFHAASAEKIRIDDYGVLRVGNTHDQTTSGNTKRIALGAKGSIWGWASGQINGALTLADNYYWDGANNKAIESDHCAFLTLRSGTLRFGCTASTQTAGNSISGGINEKVRFQQGGGISFNGDTAAANALDDYEEGTFTPALTTQSALLTVSYINQDGVYTKIGNYVYFQIYIRLSAKSGGSGQLRITNLPFAASGASGAAYGGAVMAYTYHQSGDNAFDRLMIGSGASSIQCFNGLSGGTNQNAGAGNLHSDTQLRLFGSYRV